MMVVYNANPERVVYPIQSSSCSCACVQGHLKLQTKAMSGRGKGSKSAVKSKSRSIRSGLQFPVGRIHRLLKTSNFADRISDGAAVYLATILEYLTAEVLELASNASCDNKKLRISPRHLQLAIRNDKELNHLLS